MLNWIVSVIYGDEMETEELRKELDYYGSIK